MTDSAASPIFGTVRHTRVTKDGAVHAPMRREQFDVGGFTQWLRANGCETVPPTNPYEVVRYRAYEPQATRATVHIVYAKDSGLLTWAGATRGHYLSFLQGWPLTGQLVEPLAVEIRSTTVVRRPLGGAKRKRVETRAALLERDGEACWYCGCFLGEDITIEHLVPKSKGGVNHADNYVLAHQACNVAAGNLPIKDKIALRLRMLAERETVAPWQK